MCVIRGRVIGLNVSKAVVPVSCQPTQHFSWLQRCFSNSNGKLAFSINPSVTEGPKLRSQTSNAHAAADDQGASCSEASLPCGIWCTASVYIYAANAANLAACSQQVAGVGKNCSAIILLSDDQQAPIVLPHASTSTSDASFDNRQSSARRHAVLKTEGVAICRWSIRSNTIAALVTPSFEPSGDYLNQQLQRGGNWPIQDGIIGMWGL